MNRATDPESVSWMPRWNSETSEIHRLRLLKLCLAGKPSKLYRQGKVRPGIRCQNEIAQEPAYLVRLGTKSGSEHSSFCRACFDNLG